MLTTRYDAPHSDQEWREFLQQQDFGQLIAPGRAEVPVVVPAHYCYDGQSAIELHLHRDNPVWAALSQNQHAMFTVLDAEVYIPTQWNATPGTAVEWSPPTSYYASVQVIGTATIVDDPAELGSILRRQMLRMQPEGGYQAIEPGPNPFGRMFQAIRGLRLAIHDVRAKFKFGGNKAREHQEAIAARLGHRGSEGDLRARAHLLRRMGPAGTRQGAGS